MIPAPALRGSPPSRCQGSTFATLFVFGLLALPACDTTPPPPPPPPSPPVASVQVEPKELSLSVGQTRQLTATAYSANGQALSGRPVQWVISNSTVAGVSSSGTVTAIGRGTATITATVEGQTGQAQVTVEQPVARVTVSPSTLRLGTGESSPLLAFPWDARDQVIPGLTIGWTSSAPQIASVDPDGRVTGVSAGTATITARIDTASASAAIEVVTPLQVSDLWDWTETVSFCSDTGTYAFTQSGLRLNGTSTQLGSCTGSGKKEVSALVEFGSVTTTAVSFSVRNGNVLCDYTGIGDALIATRINGSVSCTFGKGTWVALRHTPVGETRILPAAISLLKAENQSLTVALSNTAGQRIFGRAVTWAVGDGTIATVSATGVVRGLGFGTTQVTATVEGVRGSADVTIRVLELTAVAAGGKGSCGLTPQGQSYCWGSVPARVAGAPAFTSLSVGAAGACGLMADGSAYCWGDNSTYELGVPGVGSSDTPLAVAGGLQFASLTGGGAVFEDYYYGSYIQAHTCGLTPAGKAYCWGLNSSGQLGSGSGLSSQVPTPVSGGLSFAALSAGGTHTCGLTLDGKGYCWGDNTFGQLGNSLGTRNVPTVVNGGLTFTTIAAGYAHTCALTASGAAYCWGANDNGQLGSGNFSNIVVPLAVSSELRFVTIVAAAFHTCALTATGQAYCWGSNANGNLGAGPRAAATLPVAVSGGLSFASLASGSWAFHTCAIATTGGVYCWGNVGGVGAGDIGNSYQPMRVLGQQ